MAVNLNYLVTIPDCLNYITNMGYQAASNVNFENNLKHFRAAAYHDLTGYLGYEFLSDAYTDERLDGNGSHELWLKNIPVKTLVNLKEDDNVYTDFATKVRIYDEKYLFMKDDYFRKGIKNWAISYTAGWTYATLPGCIRLAALKYIYWCTQQQHIGKLSISEGSGGMVSFDPNTQDTIFECAFDHRMIRF